MTIPLPDTFTRHHVAAGGVRINALVAGSGPPVLLLHGYPQNHLIWHHVAPDLAREYTVVLTDLRGYGDSDKPASDASHRTYAKRTMAHDNWQVMRTLGFARFAVAGHDRGARVAHRMALDHPDAVTGLAVLDVVPTRYAFEHANASFGLGYYHWFFLAAPYPIPERLIGTDPQYWVSTRMRNRHVGGEPFDPAAVAEYMRCFADQAAIHASCEDYRAAATVDLADDDHDAAHHRLVTCPLLALWGRHSFVGQTYDVLAAWREYASDTHGHALPSDHYLPEEAPEPTTSALRAFLNHVS